tara:strand:- start:87 stop:413 length:327 start_codon:yes stop_codon:yes gene_type:complete
MKTKTFSIPEEKYLTPEDIRLTFKMASKQFGVPIQTLHTYASLGKIKTIHAGQGGWSGKLRHHNELTLREAKKAQAIRNRNLGRKFNRYIEYWLDSNHPELKKKWNVA